VTDPPARRAKPAVKIKALKKGFREQIRRIRESHEATVLGYIPTRLYAGMSLVTFGLYPYIWLWGNAKAFVKIGGDRVSGRSVTLFAVIGFLVQLLLPIDAVMYAAWWFIGSAQARDAVIITALAYGALQASIVLPLKCFHYFNLRWVLRSAVISWDQDGVMIERTITSWFKLFLFGSAYIQYHINRLIGLGMPSFAGADEIEPDKSIGEMIDDYIIIGGKPDYTPESWTKDDYDYDWESDYDDG
jgi:hypothetical protein